MSKDVGRLICMTERGFYQRAQWDVQPKGRKHGENGQCLASSPKTSTCPRGRHQGHTVRKNYPSLLGSRDRRDLERSGGQACKVSTGYDDHKLIK